MAGNIDNEIGLTMHKEIWIYPVPGLMHAQHNGCVLHQWARDNCP
jgi:hypothetical protein